MTVKDEAEMTTHMTLLMCRHSFDSTQEESTPCSEWMEKLFIDERFREHLDKDEELYNDMRLWIHRKFLSVRKALIKSSSAVSFDIIFVILIIMKILHHY